METGEAGRDALEASRSGGEMRGGYGRCGKAPPLEHVSSTIVHRGTERGASCVGAKFGGVSAFGPWSAPVVAGGRSGTAFLSHCCSEWYFVHSDSPDPISGRARAGPAVIRVGLARGDGRRAPASRSVTAFKRGVRRGVDRGALEP